MRALPVRLPLDQDVKNALNEQMQEADEAQLADEMQSALEHVHELGRAHRERFVDAICDSYVE